METWPVIKRQEVAVQFIPNRVKNVWPFSVIISSMKKLARLFLLCLMIIAIPMQGIAGSGMACCGEKQSSATMDQNQHQNHSMENHATDKASADTAKHSCGCCDNCCGGCGSGMCSGSKPSDNSLLEKITSPSTAPKGHVGDGPERPPRN